jgi:hypothetical protein
MSTFPTSRICPQCGGKEYTLRKPKKLAAFAADRVCKGCLTRYSPPTPLWGGIVFLMSTVAFGLFGFVFIAFLLNPFSLLGLVCEGAFCIFAFVVFIHGIRILSESAKWAAMGPNLKRPSP